MTRAIVLSMVLAIGLTLSGCHRVKDATCEPALQRAIATEYEAVVDIPVCREKKSNSLLYITAPGELGKMMSPAPAKTEGYLPAGTRLRIVKVLQLHKRWVGQVYVPLLVVDYDQFRGCVLDGQDLFSGGAFGTHALGPFHGLVAEIDEGEVS